MILIRKFFPIALITLSVFLALPSCHPAQKVADSTPATDTTKQDRTTIRSNGKVQRATITGPVPNNGGSATSRPKQ